MNSFGRTLLVTGSESLLTARAIDGRHRAALEEKPEAEVNRISGAELADSMLSEVTGGSLFSSHIIAIIDDVGATPPDVVDALVALAKDPGDQLCLILSHEGGNKGRGLADKLRKAKIETGSGAAPKPWELPRCCVEEARSRKVKLSQEAAGALVAAVGNDLRALTSAIAQLADDADGAPVDEALVQKYFAGRAEVTSFAVSDAVLAGNTSLALERLRWALGTGVAPVLITSAMAGAFRGMGKYLEARGSGADLARRIGVPPFKLKEYQRTSRNWKPAGVAAAIGIIAQADADVKGAATNPDYALERMVLGVLRQKRA
ncbi:MAG: DNA polymerase III subunit delta [Propionibacterium sp.]|nr:DNA polymerase III subunit delta [Propionibacterium sp.]